MERPGAPLASPFDGNGAVVATGIGDTRPVASAEPGATRVEHAVGPVMLAPKRRLSGATLAALAALAGAGAIALGAWGVATTLSDDETPSPSTTPVALENVQQVVSLIGKPTTATIPVQGSGRKIILVVGASGYGVLVLNGLASPPSGKTYQAWVIRPNVKAPAPAGIFTGGTGIVRLTKRVPPGGVVAITVEPAGGSPAPTQQPKLVASRT
jgi:anti-sigma-K factor RskA